MSIEQFSADAVLGNLKRFQRRTVDYVFRRLYTDPEPTTRFLVADEVGLGKTLVARGVIARTLEHLRGQVGRIDVVYVCSNLAIAQQNIRRLNVLGDGEFALSSRLTLLPAHIKELSSRRVNFISITPGTSLDPKSRGGIVNERAVIYRILRDEAWVPSRGLRNLMQCMMGKANWRWWAEDWPVDIDGGLAEEFRRVVRENAPLRERILDVCHRFRRRKMRKHVPAVDSNRRYDLIGELRYALARVCIDALEPDLVILDEFQRFKDLLDGEHEAAELAKALLAYKGRNGEPDARVLLLSATPYKMLTLDYEQGDDHYPDFIRTLRFLLQKDDQAVSAIEREIQRFRRALFAISDGDQTRIGATRSSLRDGLLQVMCRTERVGMTSKRDAMLTERHQAASLAPRDLAQAAAADRVSRAVKARDVMEYWKSSPYLLNFLRDYELRKKIKSRAEEPGDELLTAIRAGERWQLSSEQIARYQTIDPGNARMRALFADTLNRGLWRLLWMPPSLPYVKPEGPYEGIDDVTKALVFSSWNLVPDAVSVVCSYEAERRMVEGAAKAKGWGPSELYDQLAPRLRFNVSAERGPGGMPALGILNPSPALARLIDPLEVAVSRGVDEPMDASDLLAEAERRLSATLDQAVPEAARQPGRADEQWYWAAPVLLDTERGGSYRGWCQSAEGWRALETDHGDGESPQGFNEHLAKLDTVLGDRGAAGLGSAPRDLRAVIALMSVAAPGPCAVRALHRVASDLPFDHPDLLSAAARVAGGFRTLFNVPETIGLVSSLGGEAPYWQQVLTYCLAGNLQAVLDEQVHVLVESEGLQDKPSVERVQAISEEIASGLAIRVSRLRVDRMRADTTRKRVVFDHFTTRCRFALRFGDLRDDSGKTLARAGNVRTAFNSPFRPFVLASTSIGQEGLDFHTWCHAVVHWNIPSNPVDLEQREGRVHRFKGHAVRKNVAQTFGLSALTPSDTWDRSKDPWEALFQLAANTDGAGESELIPYWIFEREGGACVERRVPMLPYSKEVYQLKRLKRGLALYRLVFGQPRQEDLLAHLAGSMSPEAAERAAEEWRVHLDPPARVAREERPEDE